MYLVSDDEYEAVKSISILSVNYTETRTRMYKMKHKFYKKIHNAIGNYNDTTNLMQITKSSTLVHNSRKMHYGPENDRTIRSIIVFPTHIDTSRLLY